MALAGYSDLISGIRDWLARPGDTVTMPDTRLDDLVSMAEAEIYDRLRIGDMETSAALSVTGQTVALPSDYIEIERLYLDGTPLLIVEYLSPAQFWRTFKSGYTGRPRHFTIEGSNIVFGPAPDATYTGRLLYYARPPHISDAYTPALFTARPHMYLYGALAHAAVLVQDDDRIPLWRGVFEAALGQAQQASDRGQYSGAPLAMRPG